MKTFPSREERVNEAMLHEQECLAKYGQKWGRTEALDFHLWWHDVQYESGGYVYKVRENPKPYSGFYRQHFIEKYFSSGSEDNLIWNLENEFIGDEIDAEYIEMLLITVKDYYLFIPGALVIFDEGGAGTTQVFKALPEGQYYFESHPVASSQIIWGRKANLHIARAIRRWLKRRKKELQTKPEKPLAAPPQTSQEGSQELPPEQVAPEIIKSLSQPSDLIKLCAEKLQGKMCFGVLAVEVAKMAFNHLFDSQEQEQFVYQLKRFPNQNLRLFAIANSLKLHKVITMPAPLFVALLGEVWEINVGKRLYNKGKIYPELFEPIKDEVLSMKVIGQARLKSHTKAS